MTQTATTLRSTAREAVEVEVPEAARYSHRMNYYKLHVRRDGSLNWFESINRSDDIIDREAEGFCAVRSVTTQGTGGYACNCDHCNDESYDSRAEAIDDAVADADTSDLEADMLAEFDRIPAGYFRDEE